MSLPDGPGSDKSDRVVIEDESLRPGFTQVPNAILRHPHLSPGAKVALIVLMSYAWQKDGAFPGQATMAVDCGASERSIRTYLAELQRMAFVTIKRRGFGKTNLYIIHKIRAADSAGEVDTTRRKAAKSAALDRQQTAVLDRQDLPPKNTQLKDSEEEDSEAYPAPNLIRAREWSRTHPLPKKRKA